MGHNKSENKIFEPVLGVPVVGGAVDVVEGTVVVEVLVGAAVGVVAAAVVAVAGQ